MAVDVYSYPNTKGGETLLSQFGIASTPVVALWENGFPRYRLYDDFSKLENLIGAIELRSDLKAHKVEEKVEEQKSEEER